VSSSIDAAILGAVSVTGRRLTEQQVVFLGAGSAAVGVADYLRAAMVQDDLSEPEMDRRQPDRRPRHQFWQARCSVREVPAKGRVHRAVKWTRKVQADGDHKSAWTAPDFRAA
jgi:malic enzyme